MMGWIVAGILYFLPIALSLRDLDEEIEDVKEWMREGGQWYPNMALAVAVSTMLAWPVLMLIELIRGGFDDR